MYSQYNPKSSPSVVKKTGSGVCSEGDGDGE